MASLLEAIEIKRKMFFEHEGAPYHCLDVEVSKPTARGGQTLVRLKMRNLLTRAVFDKTFKAGDKFKEPDLVRVEAIYQYTDGDGFHFMDQDTFETLTLRPEMVAEDRQLLVDNLIVQINKFNGNPIGLQLPALVEMTIADTEPGTRGDTASGSVTKIARTDTGLELRVPLFIKEGERVKVHTRTREFAGGAWDARMGIRRTLIVAAIIGAVAAASPRAQVDGKQEALRDPSLLADTAPDVFRA